MNAIDNELFIHTSPIIGYHRSPLSQKFGAPRQPNLVALPSVIEMCMPYDTPAAFVGLSEFSHIWISWQFHHNFIAKASQPKRAEIDEKVENANKFRPQVRPPRLGGNQKVGVFASRSMYRPSGLGLSVVKLERVDIIEGRVLLIISGADMIDGTPIIDIKPYLAYSDALGDARSGFANTSPESLLVAMTEGATAQFIQLIATQSFGDTRTEEQSAITAAIYTYQQQLLADDLQQIKALIAQDPRPAYHDSALNKLFTMRYKSIDISFQLIESGALQITQVVEVLKY